jgi:hypothetical protein
MGVVGVGVGRFYSSPVLKFPFCIEAVSALSLAARQRDGSTSSKVEYKKEILCTHPHLMADVPSFSHDESVDDILPGTVADIQRIWGNPLSDWGFLHEGIAVPMQVGICHIRLSSFGHFKRIANISPVDLADGNHRVFLIRSDDGAVVRGTADDSRHDSAQK